VEAFAAARSALSDLVAGRVQLLKTSAAQIAEKSDGALKARALRDRKPTECISALCGLLENSRFRDTEDRCGEWVAAAFADKADTDWEKVCTGLVGIYRAKIMAGSPTEPPASAVAAISRVFFNGAVPLTQGQAAKAYGNLSDKTIGGVLSATPRDSIVLTYMSEGQPIPFEKASPGQQASALLRLLLRQAVGTLIVDQPEDDLDNRVMMDIVRLIRQSKNTRQLIFSTHNPNLVVNGDADKVVVMRATVPEDRAGPGAARIRPEVDGAIETPGVRHEITRIMEGGLDAFALRSRKYGA
jgi:chromosome segregation protein